MPPLLSLIAACVIFIASHRLVAGTRVRDVLIRTLGGRVYLGILSVPIIASLVWMVFAFAAARAAGVPVYWSATPHMKEVQLALTFVAFLFIVLGRTQRNPTGVFQERTIERPDIVNGMVRISRHPYLWGVALWAAGHVMVSGDAAGLILFGTLLFVAVSGTFSIDAKRRRALGEKWDAFARETSNIPFLAIVLRRQSLPLGEISWRRIGAAVVVWTVLVASHAYLFGVSPFP